jgi:hypothetical protein
MWDDPALRFFQSLCFPKLKPPICFTAAFSSNSFRPDYVGRLAMSITMDSLAMRFAGFLCLRRNPQYRRSTFQFEFDEFNFCTVCFIFIFRLHVELFQPLLNTFVRKFLRFDASMPKMLDKIMILRTS